MKLITVQELKEMIDNNKQYQLLDIRESDKFEKAHIPTAINIPQAALTDSTDLLERENPLIIYCTYGKKSQTPYLYLKEEKGFKNLYMLDGGLLEWSDAYDENMEVL